MKVFPAYHKLYILPSVDGTFPPECASNINQNVRSNQPTSIPLLRPYSPSPPSLTFQITSPRCHRNPQPPTSLQRHRVLLPRSPRRRRGHCPLKQRRQALSNRRTSIRPSPGREEEIRPRQPELLLRIQSARRHDSRQTRQPRRERILQCPTPSPLHPPTTHTSTTY